MGTITGTMSELTRDNKKIVKELGTKIKNMDLGSKDTVLGK